MVETYRHVDGDQAETDHRDGVRPLRPEKISQIRPYKPEAGPLPLRPIA